ncbi:MAG: glycosyltransferase family 4 protein [Phycisphaeraceae bacterium]|nr:glycosyltransferase family 4 protein [Phycisphaeraceae bacterium]
MSATMRIAFVLDRYDAVGGGAQRWTHDHAQRLLHDGHHIHIYARSIKGAPAGARTHLVEIGQLAAGRRLRFGAAVDRMLQNEKFDIVLDMGDGWQADVMMPHHGIRRYVYQQRSRLSHGLLRWARPLGFAVLPRYREFRKMERLQYAKKGAAAIVAVSEMVRRQLLSTYPIEPSRVVVIHNGVDLGRFKPDDSGVNRDQIRSELKWQSRTIYLTVAHDFKLKGVDRILAAMAHLRGRGRDAGLIVIGGGDIPKYERIARHMGVANDVIFMGDQEDPVPYYHASDVFVLPTLYDPCPLVVMEALACGLPVITTSYNGATELMTLPRDGVVLNDPMNVMELALAMLRFDEAETARLAPERATASRRVDLCATRMYEKHLEVYREILRERAKSPVQAIRADERVKA